MLMQGDVNKVLIQVNQILEKAFARIEALEDKVQRLETPGTTGVVAAVAPSRRGRPPGSKNKVKKSA